jgi:phosphoesterase RecJ-like protein
LWQKIIQILQEKNNFIITSHVNPDCDALGSELALAEYLHQQGKQVIILNSDPLPASYRFLDPLGYIHKYARAKHQPLLAAAEVVLVLDASGGWERVGRIGKALAATPALKICIDHHPDAADFVDIALIDTNAAATAELIYDLLMIVGSPMSATMAQALYAALITDSGNFRFPKTSPHTHQVAAALLASGVDPLYVYKQIYEQRSLNQVRLKGQVLASIQMTARGQIAYYGIGEATLEAYKVEVSELDGFASLAQEIGGVRVVVFCVQSSKSKVKISLRSDGSCPVNGIAAAYQGGGHPSAAGATVSGQVEMVLAEVVAKVKALLKDYPRRPE